MALEERLERDGIHDETAQRLLILASNNLEKADAQELQRDLLEDALIQLGETGDRWLVYRLISRKGKAQFELGETELAIDGLKRCFDLQLNADDVDERERRKQLRITSSRLIKIFESLGDTFQVDHWKAMYDQYREPRKKPADR